MPESAPHPVWSPDPDEHAARRRSLRKRRRRLILRLLSRVPTARLRMLPDFLILGAAKCGTTTLYAYLEKSPHVAWSIRKETFFFDRTFHRGLSWYRAFFPFESERRRVLAAGGGPYLVGEGTPDYLFHPHAARRAKSVLPEAKLVVILRNPVDRAYSFYRHQIQRVAEPLTFEEAVEREEERLAGELERMLRDERYASDARQNHSYVTRGRYLEQIERWLEHYPRERMLVLLMDDLVARPAETVRSMTDFLGLPEIDTGNAGKPIRALESVKLAPMSSTVRERLVEYFRPHNARLEAFLGRELDWDR